MSDADTIRRYIEASPPERARNELAAAANNLPLPAVEALAALDALVAEIESLRDRAVCSGCGGDVDEGGVCHYTGCESGEMIPSSDLSGALLHMCDERALDRDEWATEIREQADRIAWLEGDVAGWRIKLTTAEWAFADALLALRELGHHDVAARLADRWPEEVVR